MDSWGGSDRRQEKTYRHAELEDAANCAVRKVFAILGVDVDNPEKVEDFRKSLRWSDSMRKGAEHGWIAFIGIIVVAISAALWAGIVEKLGR